MLRRFPEILVLCLLATAGALVFVKNDDPAGPPAAEQAGATSVHELGPKPDPDDPHTWQTSDQVPGEIAPPVEPGQRALISRTKRLDYSPAPGVTITGWDARTPRGPVRYFVTRVKWRTPGISVDVAHGTRTRRVQPVPDMLSSTPGVIAGTNGDFYDISDTGAPLGIGRDRNGLLLNALDSGWNNAISQNTEGKWHVGELPMVAEVVGHPEIDVTNYNSARVKVDGTGIYDWRFGRSAGWGWTDLQTRNVRWVRVVDHEVVATGTTLPNRTRIQGTLIVARGALPSRRLAELTVGSTVRVRRHLDGEVRMALTGNSLLLKKRQPTVSDDGEMHPRTAVGVDRDTKEIIILVVDGRQTFSRGYTMLELANMMKRLGAEDALNLDGGGSTTLAAQKRGHLKVINTPSDGFLRSVPNGLVVSYNP
ncbi:phosphodiester glycosidase family protein [Nocardioides sp. MH1]|uniref:phosphodiester glycosidase family protein n=1 Tax=Nocardioides sp. MH1 TaxID=3242490 RepID=UPI00352107EE